MVRRLDEATTQSYRRPVPADFRDPHVVIERMADEPVYLILAMTPEHVLRMKPQNLLTGLPVRPSGDGDVSRPPPLMSIPVGVVIERRKAKSAWADFVWRPVAVLPGVPDAAPWTALDSDAERTNFYGGAGEIDFYRS